MINHNHKHISQYYSRKVESLAPLYNIPFPLVSITLHATCMPINNHKGSHTLNSINFCSQNT